MSGPGCARPSALVQSLRFLSLAILPISGSVQTLYETLSDTHCLTRRSLYLNLGYWAGGPSDMDEACEAMVDLVGRTAGLSPADDVLDVGFGFGDQDIRWMERWGPRSIRGINITPIQVERAIERVRNHGLADRILLGRGDACHLPFGPGTFDVVISLESAFHYHMREDFFREAYRVLRPGGRLVTADVIAHGCTPTWPERALLAAILGFWKIPRANLYPIDDYRQRLERTGFSPVELRSIAQDVLDGFVHAAGAALEDPVIVKRLNPVLRWLYLLASCACRISRRWRPSGAVVTIGTRMWATPSLAARASSWARSGIRPVVEAWDVVTSVSSTMTGSRQGLPARQVRPRARLSVIRRHSNPSMATPTGWSDG